MNYTKNSTVSEIILGNVKAAEIFEYYNFNYSTEGRSTISEACFRYGIQTGKILKDLNQLNGNGLFKIKYWKADFLCDYIEMNHHSYIRKSLPKILRAVKTLSKENKEIEILKNRIMQLSSDFEMHMQKEEKLLFPYIKKLVKLQQEKIKFEMAPFGEVSGIIKVMEKEHCEANNNILNIRKICNNFRTLKGENQVRKNLYDLLKEFETDFHIHVHFENYLLFPAAVTLEKKLKNRKY